MTHTILIAGCGDVGIATALELIAQGHQVYGLRRTIDALPDSIHAIKADLGDKSTLSSLPAADILIYCATPSERSEAGYRAAYLDRLKNVLAALPTPPKHLFFTSSTSVYGQNAHEWVTEESPAQPQDVYGQIMCEAEQQVFDLANGCVVRFSGIYGPGRHHLINRVKAGVGAPQTPVHYSNRIHRDDCAGALAHLVQRALLHQPLERCYLVSDLEPTPIHTITDWLAGKLNVTLNTHTPIQRGGSKRCDSQRLRDSGYQFRYPNYQAGFNAILAGLTT